MRYFTNILRWISSQEHLYFLFGLLFIIPNCVFLFTEPLPVPVGLASIVMPLAFWMGVLLLARKPGVVVWCLLPKIILDGGQLVLLYLFGESVIAVDMFLNLTSSNASEASELLGNIFLVIVCVFFFYTLLFLAGFLLLLLLRPNAVDSPIYRLMMLLPNIGFMGIPIVASLLGTDYIIYVAVYMLFYNVILYTYGIFLCKKSAKAENKDSHAHTEPSQPWFKPIITNPGVIASVIALLIFFLKIPIPDEAATFCDYMGNPAIPLSMYLIGCSVAFSDIRSILKNTKVYGFLLFKMLLFPIACTFLVHLLPFDDMIVKLFIIMTSMPAGSLVVLVAEEYAGNTTAATNGVVLSTLSSILSIISTFM